MSSSVGEQIDHKMSMPSTVKQRSATAIGKSLPANSVSNLTLTRDFVDGLPQSSKCCANANSRGNCSGNNSSNNNHNNSNDKNNNSNNEEEGIKCHHLMLIGQYQHHVGGQIIDESKNYEEDIDSDFSSQSCESNCNDQAIECSSDREPLSPQQRFLCCKKEKSLIVAMDNQTKKLKEAPHDLKESKTSSSSSAHLDQYDEDNQRAPKEEEDPPSPSYSPRSRILFQPHKLVSLGERNGHSSVCNKHMPWFGIDVGGSLVKMVFFDPKDATAEETATLKRIRKYLKSSKPYGTTGKRDAHLEMPNCIINKRVGSLHFIRFATSKMPQFLSLAKRKRFAESINSVCATGGGAYKFEEDIESNLGINLHKTDELDSIIYGIHYIDKYNPERECYFLEDPLDDNKCVKVPYDFSRPYPYLVVNIGSGVSILAVYSSTSYSRISGSSIGGGTFLGLCSLLTQCKTFDEAISLAKAGSSSKIDKLVKDIYGGDYPKFNLSGDTVASSFGHMNMAEKRKEVKREDLARALLEMVTINIGSIARMCAANEDIDRVVFIGNFLRVNQLSMKLLSYAVNYWSKGAMKALFLEHEGYFGAVGCFVESTQGCHH